MFCKYFSSISLYRLNHCLKFLIATLKMTKNTFQMKFFNFISYITGRWAI